MGPVKHRFKSNFSFSEWKASKTFAVFLFYFINAHKHWTVIGFGHCLNHTIVVWFILRFFFAVQVFDFKNGWFF